MLHILDLTVVVETANSSLLIKNKANKKDFLWNYKVITIISTKFSARKSAVKHDLMTFQYLVCSHATQLLLIGFDFWLLKCKVTWGRFCDLPLFVPFSESVRLSMQYVGTGRYNWC